jgi:MYXO-CTERM domain-containing protein
LYLQNEIIVLLIAHTKVNHYEKEEKPVLKKILHSLCVLSVTLMLCGVAVYAQNNNMDVDNNTNKIVHMAQNEDIADDNDDDDTDWGWIGLLGLAGLLGLRRRDDRRD